MPIENFGAYRGFADFLLDIKLGKVPNLELVEKFGYNLTAGAAPEAVWPLGGAYTGFLTAAQNVRVAAGNAADTVAGAGARRVRITGLVADFTERTEILDTNGLAAGPNSIHQYVRINSAEVVETGAYGVGNTGAVNIEETGAASVMAHIAAGDSVDHQAVFTIPAGKKGYLIGRERSASQRTNEEGAFDLRVREGADIVAPPFKPSKLISFFDGVKGYEYSHELSRPLLPSKTDVWAEGYRGGSADTSLTSEFVIILMPE